MIDSLFLLSQVNSALRYSRPIVVAIFDVLGLQDIEDQFLVTLKQGLDLLGIKLCRMPDDDLRYNRFECTKLFIAI